MTKNTISRTSSRFLLGVCAATLALTTTAGAQTTTTELAGTVVQAEGSQLVVRMSTGELRTFTVPAGKTALIDGRETSIGDLKPGTTLKATVTTSRTSAIERTVQTLSGKVWFAQGQTVILTLPDGTNRQYNVKDDVKFTVNGQPATVHDLRKGMNVTAQKITEEPTIQVAQNSRVTGIAPGAGMAGAPPAVESPGRAASSRSASASSAASGSTSASSAPATLPKTASPLPLVGLLGLLLTAAGLGLRKLRRQ
jgi:hypothetical protein